MIILIFGVPNVGKTTTGELLAKKINYSFYDLDSLVRKKYGTIDNFNDEFPFPYERGKELGAILKNLILNNKNNNVVITVMMIWYARWFNRLLEDENVFALELQDSPEHIFSRLIFADENDVIYKDDDYKNAHKDHYLNEIASSNAYVKNTFRKIKTKIYMDNKPVEEVVEMVRLELQKQAIID